MTDEKITDLTALTGAGVATGDLFVAVDVSDTTMAATGTNKKITADELRKAMGALGETSTDAIWDAKGDLAVATGADAASKLTVGADGTQLVADSSQTTGLAWKSRSRSVSDTHTDTSAVNTATETVVASQAIPSTVAAGDLVRLVAMGDALNNSGAAVSYTLKGIVGATTAVTSNNFSLANAGTRHPWVVNMDMLVVATNDQRIAVLAVVATNAGTGWNFSAGNSLPSAGRGTAAEDLTAGKNFQLSVTMNAANASADFVCHESWLEVIKR